MVSHHGGALAAPGPVAAGRILVPWPRASVRRGAGQDLVHVDGITASRYDIAFLGERGLFRQIVLAVKLVDILRNYDPFYVTPRTPSDAVARGDCGRAAERAVAEIGAPCAATGSGGLRKHLTVPVSARETAEVRALSTSGAVTPDFWSADTTESTRAMASSGDLPGITSTHKPSRPGCSLSSIQAAAPVATCFS